MDIRLATVNDCKQLVEMRIDMRNEREKPLDKKHEDLFLYYSTKFFNEEILTGRFIAYVAEEQDKIIAMSGLSLYSVPPTYDNLNGKVAYLMNMYTRPQYRKKGLGTILLQKAVEYAKENNYSKVILNASEMGRPLYTKYGFTDLENEMVYIINNVIF